SLALSDTVESKKQEMLAAISSGELEIESDEAVTEISRGASSDRWGINLLHKNTGKSAQLVIDFELNEGSWEIRNLRLAPEIQEMEALGVAEQFVQALVNGDYPAAQTWITADSVDSEKLAGLSVVIEEAAFQLIEREPLMVTSVSDERAWIIVRVMSEELNLR